ncbi:aminotransferase class III-fold pyridoxal phosphate-dependent enzyme [Candidatus Gottesmanbacteria bacterium]|nr:aminotransferase class III-fold pyridoxal phosphate-dependent enzyme [Candidatus Gottesmanbacteria bacterium]
MNTIQMEDTYQLPTYQKFPLVINRGKDVYVFDEKGNKYLDFYGGHAVALIGHCHPQVINAISKQLRRLIFYSNVVYNEQRAQAAKKLVGLAPKYLSSVFFCNSGTEANETALKLAKKFTRKDEIISFEGSFHGRTVGALSVTGSNKYKKHVGSLIPHVKFAKFGDIESVKKLISSNTSAIIVETIQSIAGVNVADINFYIDLKRLASKNKIVLIFDEVQTGLGRTGKMFFGQHFGVMPDILTLAKGIAGGLPAGAVLVSKIIAKSVENGDQGCTFGGGPVICSAILATLDVIKKEKLPEKAAKYGDELKDKIHSLPHVLGVYGKGLLLGIELDLSAKNIQNKLLANFILTGTSDNPNVLRIMPPLTITEKEVAIFLNTLSSVLKE